MSSSLFLFSDIKIYYNSSYYLLLLFYYHYYYYYYDNNNNMYHLYCNGIGGYGAFCIPRNFDSSTFVL